MEQEYIKGDIVMYDNKIHTIMDALGVNNYELSYIEHPVHQLELSGVPLTFKILENNGWKLYKHHIRSYYDDITWIVYHKPSELEISLVFYVEENAFFLFVYGEQISGTPIKYIHQLQHILWVLTNNTKLKI